MKNPLILFIYLFSISLLFSCQDDLSGIIPQNELKGQLVQIDKKPKGIVIDFKSTEQMIQFLSILEKDKLSKTDSLIVISISSSSMSDSIRQLLFKPYNYENKIQLLGNTDDMEICTDCINNNPKGFIRYNLDWLRNFSANFTWNKNGEVDNVFSRLDGFFFGGSYVQDYWNQFGNIQPNGNIQLIIGGHWEIIVSVNGSLNFGYSHPMEELYITYNTLTGAYTITSVKPSAWKIH
ncbi:MAG: hypothetical protein RL360_314 [Bacteroidota bacterium]|jgi:hypothetical protein